MTDKNIPTEGNASSAIPWQELRDRAEVRLGKKAAFTSENIAALTTEEIQQMLYELRVHQIELMMQNEELRESHLALDLVRARYFDLYDQAPIGYFTLSEQGLILQVNLTAANMLASTHIALTKQPFSRIVLNEDQDIFYLRRKRLLETDEAQSFDLRVVRGDGLQFWANLLITRNSDANGIKEIRIVMNDISESKKTEAKVNEAKMVAEKANLAKSEFLACMSHELRTPLNAILGFAQLLGEVYPPPTPAYKDKVNCILESGWHLLELINEILDLAMVESGKIRMSMEQVSLAEAFRKCDDMLKNLAKGRNIIIKFTCLDTPYFVMADSTRLKQVLVNLLSNAIQYNKVNGMVTVTCSEIKSGRVRINIADTGDGITAENLTQLFQPFNRLGKEASIEKGTGIGLVTSKYITELMNGSIGVESVVGQGSTFWFELDLVDEPPSQLADRKQVVAHMANAKTIAPTSSAKKYNLLYIEDNTASLMLIESIITRRPDINLLTANDGCYGFEIALKTQPNAIFMDINLPSISGVEALKMLKEEPLTAHIPVIALSANAMPSYIEMCLEAGFVSFLTKPIKISDLMDVLNTVLNPE